MESLETKSKICVIGGGRWGVNHIRTLYQMGNLGGIVESRTKRLSELISEFPGIKGYENVEDSLKDNYKGYVLATPAETHFKIGSFLLENGKNVLIEKPLALSSKDAEKLLNISRKNGLILMVGHVMLFHPAIRKVKEIIDEGKIGKLQYIYSNRLNLGTVRTEENVFWSFAPHDISIFDYIIGSLPISISTSGGAFLQNNIHDTVVTNLSYSNNVKAHIFVSWLHPFKEQRLVIVGTKGMISFEDSSENKQIFFYEKGIDWVKGEPVKREGLKVEIEYEKSLPLENELKYFINNLGGKIEIADGTSGLNVVKILEEATKSLKAVKDNKANTDLDKNFFVHESAYIDDDVKIGENTKVWHFSHIQKGAEIGNNTTIGQNVNIANNVKVGSYVKIQNNVSVYEGVTLEDYVFCGPSMVFTNVNDPRCKYPQQGGAYYLKTLIKEGASMGANSTIVCGHTIGKHAFIAAGAVVAADVPDYALMIGVPAKRRGWVCECGEQLKSGFECKRCGRIYIEENEMLKEGKKDDTIY